MPTQFPSVCSDDTTHKTARDDVPRHGSTETSERVSDGRIGWLAGVRRRDEEVASAGLSAASLPGQRRRPPVKVLRSGAGVAGRPGTVIPSPLHRLLLLRPAPPCQQIRVVNTTMTQLAVS